MYEYEPGNCPSHRIRCGNRECYRYGVKPEYCMSDVIKSLNSEVEFLVFDNENPVEVKTMTERDVLEYDQRKQNYIIMGAEDILATLNFEDGLIWDLKGRKTDLRRYLGEREIVPLPLVSAQERRFDVRASELTNDCAIAKAFTSIPNELNANIDDYFREQGLLIRTSDWYGTVGRIVHKVCLTQPTENFVHNELKFSQKWAGPRNRGEYCEKTLAFDLERNGYKIRAVGHPDMVCIAKDSLVINDLKTGKNPRKVYPLQLLFYALGVVKVSERDFENYVVLNTLHKGFNRFITAKPRFRIFLPEKETLNWIEDVIWNSYWEKQVILEDKRNFMDYRRMLKENEACDCYKTTRLLCDFVALEFEGSINAFFKEVGITQSH